MQATRSWLLAATALVAPATAFAQSEQPQTDVQQAEVLSNADIVVTATRRETKLQETPLSITAVSAETLRTKGISSLSDFSVGSVPGMNFVPITGNPSALGITARGLGDTDPVQGTGEVIVPVYIDGVPLGRAQGLGADLIDPERVEFLRGPQGQLFGRNAEGGAVQFVSRRPSGDLKVDATAGISSFGGNKQVLRVDLPEFANLRIQGALVHNEHDGYTRNRPAANFSSQADFGLQDTFGYRVAVEWNPVSDLRVNYAYDHANITESQPYLMWSPVDIIGLPPFSPQPAGVDNYLREVTFPVYNETFKTRGEGHALTLLYSLSDAISLKSITSYRETGRNGATNLGPALVAGGSSTGILMAVAQENLEQNQWYQEVQALGSWDRLDLTVGATYFREKVADGRRSYLTGPGLTPPALGLGVLAGCIGLELCTVSHSEQNASTKSYGIYAQGTYRPIDNLELTAGIRYSDDTKDAVRTYVQPLALPPYAESDPSGPLPPARRFQAKRWDPAFTVKYNFTQDLNAYVRYATAYRAGGANVRSSAFSIYNAEVLQSFEAGIKSQWFDRRMTLNLVYYHNNLKNAQVTVQEQPTTNSELTDTVNVTKPTKFNGFEGELTIRPTDGLTFAATYSYIKVRQLDEFDNPLTPVVDLTRFYRIQAPRHSGNISADYVSPEIAGGANLAFHADYSWSSSYWTTPGGLQVASLGPTYSRPTTKSNMLNSRVAVQNLTSYNAEVSVFVRNLIDDTNYTYAFDGAAAGGGFGEYLVPPRTFGVELRIKY